MFYEKSILIIFDDSQDGLFFELVANDERVKFELTLLERTEADGSKIKDFSIENKSAKIVKISYGRNNDELAELFFKKYTPTIWFADGSSLTGNEFVLLKQIINPYPKDELIDDWDWTGIDIGKESQKVEKLQDSIQYRVIERLKQGDYDIIYDDDGSGEIADVITLKLESDKIKIELYHLKFAKGGIVSNQIGNFYEVCGQAQKSIHWKHKSGDELINHLFRRIEKKWNDAKCSRLEKGSAGDLEKLLQIAKKRIPVEFTNFIVQPGVSSSNVSDDILTLLGVTENYIKQYAAIPLKVVVNS